MPPVFVQILGPVNSCRFLRPQRDRDTGSNGHFEATLQLIIVNMNRKYTDQTFCTWDQLKVTWLLHRLSPNMNSDLKMRSRGLEAHECIYC